LQTLAAPKCAHKLGSKLYLYRRPSDDCPSGMSSPQLHALQLDARAQKPGPTGRQCATAVLPPLFIMQQFNTHNIGHWATMVEIPVSLYTARTNLWTSACVLLIMTHINRTKGRGRGRGGGGDAWGGQGRRRGGGGITQREILTGERARGPEMNPKLALNGKCSVPSTPLDRLANHLLKSACLDLIIIFVIQFLFIHFNLKEHCVRHDIC
jgi:hypothetical protein